jgi:predicted nucleotidyltransferase
MPESRLFAALRTFQEAEVQFILVGGVAAVLNGAPVQTFDIDLLYAVEPANIDRLLPVLERMEAIFRIQPERRLRPTRSHLAGGGHLNLLTRFGPLDLLGSIGQNLRYPDLLPHSHDLNIGEGIRIRVLNLETLIAVKEELAGEKDLAVLPILRRTLREIRNKDDSEQL